MRGVLLAGGSGSRLLPLTRAVNKHLLPVGGQPMILHGLRKLTGAGIADVLVVTGPEAVGAFAALLGSGEEYGCRVHFRVQQRPGGIAEALSLAEGFAAGEPILALLGDNLFEGELAGFRTRFESQGGGARVLLAEADDPERLGVAELKDGRVVSIEEKPAQPRSNLAVIGVYAYDGAVFDHIRGLSRSARGELEITDVNRTYLARGELQHELLQGWWEDAGTHASLAAANRRFPVPET
ncbi:MAG: sugar phosphate nucleotidyltransferase [Myxococcales bacterium]